MKIELTLERLEEIATAIVVNQLSEEQASDYIRTVAFECHEETVKQSNETLEWI
jgi:hypothetical protein